MTRRINKAVFPVAGLGTRTLPATKVLAKEMLTLVDRPIIQHAVEDALSAGITELIFVTAESKQSIQDHFRPNPRLEQELAQRGKQELLERVKNIPPPGISCDYVLQHEPLGLGHAVLCAKSLVGEEPFAVILPDDLIHNEERTCLQQMMEIYRETDSNVVAVENVPREQVSRYGTVETIGDPDGAVKMKSIVEKPAPEEAPSTLAVVGRYIFTPAIMPLLETTPRGAGNEIQLTDAIAGLLDEEDVYLCAFQGQRYDCGSILGYMKANVEYALRHEAIGAEFRSYITGLLK
jgi:UTP--glucose-1-phosphate uridylyltransferase